MRRLLMTYMIALFMLCIGSQSYAWLYDGGSEQRLSVGIKENDGTSTVWAAALFSVSKDSYATSFGAALAKGSGVDGTGFRMYLAPSPDGLPESTLGSWLISPTGPIPKYYYAQAESPIFLQAGHVYALVFTPSSSDFWGSISYSGKYGRYDLGSSDYGNSWYSLPLPYPLAIRVDGYYVPEPGSFAALAFGIIGVLGFRRRT